MTKSSRQPGNESAGPAQDGLASRLGAPSAVIQERTAVHQNTSSAGQVEGLGTEPRVGMPPARDPEHPPVPVAPLPRLAYRVEEVAGMLGVSEKSVRRLVARGLLKPSRALRHLLITRQELDRFLRSTSR